jgi:hypothetical protein
MSLRIKRDNRLYKDKTNILLNSKEDVYKEEL